MSLASNDTGGSKLGPGHEIRPSARNQTKRPKSDQALEIRSGARNQIRRSRSGSGLAIGRASGSGSRSPIVRSPGDRFGSAGRPAGICARRAMTRRSTGPCFMGLAPGPPAVGALRLQGVGAAREAHARGPQPTTPAPSSRGSPIRLPRPVLGRRAELTAAPPVREAGLRARVAPASDKSDALGDRDGPHRRRIDVPWAGSTTASLRSQASSSPLDAPVGLRPRRRCRPSRSAGDVLRKRRPPSRDQGRMRGGGRQPPW